MKPMPRVVCTAVLTMAVGSASLAQQSRAEEASASAAEGVVRVFIDACVRSEGELTAAVDWAINHNFSPADVTAVDIQPLLAGRAGSVFAMPGSAASVLLAVTTEGRCTVWAERTSGPSLRRALQQAAAQLAARGARVQPILDRTIEHAGAWRQHLQLRYRRVGGSQDFGISVVTTATATAGQQALHFAPAPPPAPATQADGPVVR